MIEKMQLAPGAELFCFRDSRFRQGCLSIQFLRRMDIREAAMNALVPNVLLRGTRTCPDLRSITMRLDDLYGAGISPLVRSVGDLQTTGLYCSFMESRFAMPGDRLLENMTEFIREILLDSPEQDGGFLPDYTESEKRNLIASIEADLNDKQVYASGRLLQEMCRNDPFGIPRLGGVERTEKITPAQLLQHWQRVLRESPVQIVYVGSEASENVAQLLRPLLDIPGREPRPLPPQTGFVPGEEKNITETMEVAQAKLCMGFATPDNIRTEGNAAVQLLNVVFGGGMTSKLFMNIREKQSLCYSIGSGMFSAKGIMTVSAGIDAEQFEPVRAEILHQLELCRKGEITDEELTAAREAMISGLRSAHDAPGAIEAFYGTMALSGARLTPDEYIRQVRAVKREQVAEAAQRLQLNTVYLLKGGRSDG